MNARQFIIDMQFCNIIEFEFHNYTEYNQHEIEGKDLGYLRGDLTDPLLIEQVRYDSKYNHRKVKNYHYDHFVIQLHLNLSLDDVKCQIKWIRKRLCDQLYQKWQAFLV
jgi:hypothetical protein